MVLTKAELATKLSRSSLTTILIAIVMASIWVMLFCVFGVSRTWLGSPKNDVLVALTFATLLGSFVGSAASEADASRLIRKNLEPTRERK